MNKRILGTVTFVLIAVMLFAACTPIPAESPVTEVEGQDNAESKEVIENEVKEVNLYTDRHYDADQALYDQFEAETGIKVNVVKAKSDELIERLVNEGEDTEADLLITADAGRLVRAKDKNLFQPITSEAALSNVPGKYTDSEAFWIGLTKRARVIAYDPSRVSVEELSTYEALTDEAWEGKILIRSSSNIYNQSLMASFIDIMGEDGAKAWAEGLVANMARVPAGNDRDQAKAVVAGEGELAVMNTYYIGKLLNSSDPEEVKVGEQIAVFFPNQETTGTHINISGVGITKYSKNIENANLLVEFLTGEVAQKGFAETNYEYPVNPAVEPSDLLKSWGEFKEQDIKLQILGENNLRAVQLFNEVSWQ